MKKRVTYVGNFGPRFSTENDISWTFQDMGWEVAEAQENVCDSQHILKAALDSDLLLWTSTHGWQVPGIPMEIVLQTLHEHQIPTAAIHLDRYVGLNINDQREDRIGVAPWWKCQYVFTADGGNQERFAERGVNHVWSPPAIAKRHCKLGRPRPEFTADVCYVGAKHYHPEYPFRTQLVNWLDGPHKWTFKRWGGGDRPSVREELSDVYASCKIVVGDSCFAGASCYWSDRCPEVMGRGGFLLHPWSVGMTFEGMGTYLPQNIQSLDGRINRYLNNLGEREMMRVEGFEWVKAHETYHNRVEKMLEVIFG